MIQPATAFRSATAAQRRHDRRGGHDRQRRDAGSGGHDRQRRHDRRGGTTGGAGTTGQRRRPPVRRAHRRGGHRRRSPARRARRGHAAARLAQPGRQAPAGHGHGGRGGTTGGRGHRRIAVGGPGGRGGTTGGGRDGRIDRADPAAAVERSAGGAAVIGRVAWRGDRRARRHVWRRRAWPARAARPGRAALVRAARVVSADRSAEVCSRGRRRIDSAPPGQACRARASRAATSAPNCGHQVFALRAARSATVRRPCITGARPDLPASSRPNHLPILRSETGGAAPFVSRCRVP